MCTCACLSILEDAHFNPSLSVAMYSLSPPCPSSPLLMREFLPPSLLPSLSLTSFSFSPTLPPPLLSFSLYQDCGVVPQLMDADVVVRSLVQDQPLALDQNDYNLEIKVYTCTVLYTHAHKS